MTAKIKLLTFFEKYPSDYISGQKIGDTLHISRNSVWKAVEQLRADGYEIESKPRSGYRLIAKPDTLSQSEISAYLQYPCNLQVYDAVTSTMAIAKESIIKDIPEYIVANSQTSGRGRLGRSFLSPSGTGLYLTIVLKPDFSIEKALYVTMAVAVSTARAIEKVCHIKADIKWVNDLFYENRKICGILTEAQTNLETGQIDTLLIGIGINCFSYEFPDELQDIAGPITKEKNSFSRNQLAAEIYNETIKLLSNFDSRNFMDEYRNRCFILGKTISVHPYLDNRAIKALSLDINDTGGLIVKYLDGEKSGQTDTLTTGEVSIRLE